MNGENTAVRCETEAVAEQELKSVTSSVEKLRVGHYGSSGPEIPLWDKEQTLTWDLNEESIQQYLIENKEFNSIEEVQKHIRMLMQSAIDLWGGDSIPVKFIEKKDGIPSFNIILIPYDDCNGGCVLASAFFPNAKRGKRNLSIYPLLFRRGLIKQIETIAHEIGHILGCRHWFADISETDLPSEKFGFHDKNYPESIMNYEKHCRMTFYDVRDIQKLYSFAWNKEITGINKVPIKFYKS